MSDLEGRLYFYSGIDVGRDSAYGWAGTAWSPFGAMDKEGFRLRVQGGGGRYRYRTGFVPGGWNTGTGTDGEVLGGWQFQSGTTAFTLYGGINVASDILDHPDPSNPAQGTQAGGKIVGEWFMRPAEGWVLTASASYATVFETATARATVARRLFAEVDAGAEAAYYRDSQSQEAKFGLFVATPIAGRTFTLSSGWRWSDDSDPGLYGMLTLFAPF
ncbi:cellulose biosynthesis protein BcsS [Ancylobacter terrae]|uniref:cellulose biosynthesis protein BcsS n=1 Tax=Ancylobacter sp. sgz301288 TaxID=3342077 RepID=UPI00385BA81A